MNIEKREKKYLDNKLIIIFVLLFLNEKDVNVQEIALRN